MEVATVTPKGVRISRARVWQKEWAPMPWDSCRRTACTETADSFILHEEYGEKERIRREVDIKTPKGVRTCRARVWQAEWDPMPWDHCRRTPYTQTNVIEEPEKQAKVKEEEIRTPRPKEVRSSRARVWQEGWDPMPWDHCRRTPYTETKKETYQSLSEREKKRREAKLNRYQQYQRQFYSSPSEREIRNSQIRTHLKGQLELIEPPYRTFVKRVAESQEIAEKNRLEEMKEKEENRQHRNYLSHFRINNKMVMEQSAEEKKEQKLREVREEQKRLRLNPINWSYSLW